MKVKKTRIKMNPLKIIPTQAKSNFFVRCMERSNDLIKVQRIAIVCIRAILLLCDLWKWSYPAFIRDLPHLLEGYTEEAPRSTYKEMKEVLNLMIENEQIAAWPEEMELLKG